MVITKITENNLQQVEPQMLLEPQRYQEVEDAVLRVGGSGSPSFAAETASALSGKLEQVSEGMDKALFANYLNLLKLLRLFGLRSSSDREKEQVFRELILNCFSSGLVDVREEVEMVFRSYFDSPDITENLRKLFLGGLEANSETIGKQEIAVTVGGEEKMVKPTLQSWLLDYNGNVHIDQATHRRSGFDQTNYMLHSLNVQKLSKEEKELLLKVIQFYDWLRFDPLHFDFSLPGEQPQRDWTIEISKPTKLIPDDIREIVEKMRREKAAQVETVGETPYLKAEKFVMPEETSPAAENKPQPPVVPKKPNIPAPKTMADIEASKELGDDQEKEVENPLVRPLQPVQKAGQPKPERSPQAEKIAELLRKGSQTAKSETTDPWDVDYNKPVRPVNIQDILSKKKTIEDHQAGIKIGDSEGEGKDLRSNPKPEIPNIKPKEELAQTESRKVEQVVVAQEPPVQKKSEEINKKLEELKKKIKS